jgi:long-chain acyl-CoA synthetase
MIPSIANPREFQVSGSSEHPRTMVTRDAAAMPRAWGCGWTARVFRRLTLPWLFLLPARIIARIRVEGLENLKGITGPVIFAVNHRSYIDTPVLFAALPARWRYRVAPSMCDCYFGGEGHWPRLWSRFRYFCTVLWLNAFTLPRAMSSLHGTLRHMRNLTSSGWSILIYPEGERSSSRVLLPFEPGVGSFAAKLGLPVIPVHLDGTERILHRTASLPRRGRASVRFGTPILLRGMDYGSLTRQIERAVRDLGS